MSLIPKLRLISDEMQQLKYLSHLLMLKCLILFEWTILLITKILVYIIFEALTYKQEKLKRKYIKK